MTHRRSPFQRREDGHRKGLAITRNAFSHFWDVAALMQLDIERPPSPVSAERTRSKCWRAGSRRTRRYARGAR